MSNDASLPVRRAILTALKADAGVTALVPAERVFPTQPSATPEWPFIRYGAPTALPFLASGMDGARVVFALHGFAKGPGDDKAANVGAAMAKALGGRVLVLEGGAKATIQWRGSQLLADPAEASAWHTVQNFEASVAS